MFSQRVKSCLLLGRPAVLGALFLLGCYRDNFSASATLPCPQGSICYEFHDQNIENLELMGFSFNTCWTVRNNKLTNDRFPRELSTNPDTCFAHSPEISVDASASRSYELRIDHSAKDFPDLFSYGILLLSDSSFMQDKRPVVIRNQIDDSSVLFRFEINPGGAFRVSAKLYCSSGYQLEADTWQIKRIQLTPLK